MAWVNPIVAVDEVIYQPRCNTISTSFQSHKISFVISQFHINDLFNIYFMCWNIVGVRCICLYHECIQAITSNKWEPISKARSNISKYSTTKDLSLQIQLDSCTSSMKDCSKPSFASSMDMTWPVLSFPSPSSTLPLLIWRTIWGACRGKLYMTRL